MEPTGIRASYRPLTPTGDEDIVQYAELGNVLMARSDGHETGVQFRILETNLRSVAQRNGGKVAILYMVDHSLGPAPGFADHAKRVMSEHEKVLVGVGTVLLPEGFVAALYRSVGAMLVRVVDRRGLITVTNDIGEAASWLVERLPKSLHTPSADALTKSANLLLSAQRAARGHLG